MAANYPTPLISTEWLQAHLSDPRLVLLDSSYHLPPTGRSAKDEFPGRHIAGARFFDFDDAISDPENPLPHMLPEPQRFADEVGKLGISNDSFIVCYDVNGLSSAARCWWMFRVFGHDAVSVLDGGLPKWEREQRPMSDAAPAPATPSRFTPTFRAELVKSAADVNASLGSVTILDARSAGRFAATEPEPRAGLRGGHIPESLSFPFQKVLNDDKTLRSKQDLVELFNASHVDIRTPIICTCGSGVSACNLALAVHIAGGVDAAIYDGSWSEWGGRDDLPVAR